MTRLALGVALAAALQAQALEGGLTSVVNKPNLYFGTRTVEEHAVMVSIQLPHVVGAARGAIS